MADWRKLTSYMLLIVFAFAIVDSVFAAHADTSSLPQSVAQFVSSDHHPMTTEAGQASEHCGDPCHVGHCHFGHGAFLKADNQTDYVALTADSSWSPFTESILATPYLEGLRRPPRLS